MMQFKKNDILVHKQLASKEEALEYIAKHMHAQGYADETYVETLKSREQQGDTFLGYGVALPHGKISHNQHATMTILQVPHGVYWNDKGDLAYFIVAIAANSHEHLHLLSLLTTALSHEELAYFLGKEASIDDIFNILNAPQTVIKKYIASGARMAFKGLSHPMGFAYGSIYLLQDFNHDLHMPPKDDTQHDVALEQQKLQKALVLAAKQLDDIHAKIVQRTPQKAEIFQAHKLLLKDNTLLDAALHNINNGYDALAAWKMALETQIDAFKSVGASSHIEDLQDISLRVQHILQGYIPHMMPHNDENMIIVAKEVLPSTMFQLRKLPVKGIIVEKGSLDSHSAILAQSWDIPMITAVEESLLQHAKHGELAFLDSYNGEIILSPNDKDYAQAIQLVQIHRSLEKYKQQHTPEQAKTTDDYHLPILGNLHQIEDAPKMLNQGLEGVGLLRSEFMYMQHAEPPSIALQVQDLKQLIKLFDTQILRIRLFDLGYDKQVEWLSLPTEDNAAFGLRAINLLLQDDYRWILERQLAAIYQTALWQMESHATTSLQIMIPMIDNIAQWHEVKNIAEHIRIQLKAPYVPMGVMIETPAAAFLADHFAKLVDFFSIGSNDLYQYSLAKNRNHSTLSSPYEHYNPVILRFIDHVITAAHAQNKPVGICGNLAGNPDLIPILIGLNIDNISIKKTMIAPVKLAISSLSYKECAELAQKALACASEEEVYFLCNP